jgi:hypothetical protein
MVCTALPCWRMRARHAAGAAGSLPAGTASLLGVATLFSGTINAMGLTSHVHSFRAVLMALLTAFLLIVQASNDFQCVHIAPGIDCFVHPAWALWCAYSASFAWMALAVLAMIGGPCTFCSTA